MFFQIQQNLELKLILAPGLRIPNRCLLLMMQIEMHHPIQTTPLKHEPGQLELYFPAKTENLLSSSSHLSLAAVF